ncbi:MAG: phage tail assembly chaperone [Sphingobacteriia bacterium]|nr:phage tail assembly chaperone [Sphingobacteriia bacterium]
MHNEKFPWEIIFKISFQILKLKPNELWQMTPREFMILLGDNSHHILSKNEFEQLKKQFPDY